MTLSNLGSWPRPDIPSPCPIRARYDGQGGPKRLTAVLHPSIVDRAWSASIRLFAYRSTWCHAAGTSWSSTRR
jgi:hypothetical protein